MIDNYIKVAWRHTWSDKVLATIKISGLALGLTVCLLILLYNKDETSFDRFHQQKDRIYRVVQTMEVGKDQTNTLGVTQSPLGPAFQKAIPDIEQYVRIDNSHATIRRNKEVFAENPMLADSLFFSMFSFELIKGNPLTALSDPHSVVLSEDAAIKYFGTLDVLGKVLEIKKDNDFELFTISGLVENAPVNSTLQYQIILPFSFDLQRSGWLGGGPNTFLLVKQGVSISGLRKKIQGVFDENTKEQIAGALREQNLRVKVTLDLQPITDIHLSKSFRPDNGLMNGSSPIYSYVLSGIAFFILIIACINFINLAVAQSLKRSREIGIRKVIGGTRNQLIVQFMIESFLITTIAFVLALVLTNLLMPLFNRLADKKLAFSYIADGSLYLSFLGLWLITAFVAGCYPALILSNFKPVKVLYGREKLMGRNYFTRGLIVLQFTLAIFLIIGTLVIYSQMNFFFHQDLGYKPENLVKIDLPFSEGNDALVSRFRNALSSKPEIISVAARNRGMSITGAKTQEKQIIIDYNRIDESFIPTFGLNLAAGRNFSQSFGGDSLHSVIVNEQFVREAGWTNSGSLGKSISAGDDSKKLTIVGVIRDYHFQDLKKKIMPQLFTLAATDPFGQIWVRIKPQDAAKTLAVLESAFRHLSPFYPYTYAFMNDINTRNYQAEIKWKQIIGIAATLFVLISCMGLFGLVILSVQQRTKEIGIRKVLGAAAARIVLLISKDFLLLVVLAFVLAAPMGYWATDRWLQSFAYRINITWWLFAGALLLVMLLALLTISVKAIGAALANPVDSLRAE